MLTVEPRAAKASDVEIIGGSLNNKEVSDCLVEKMKDFEYPRDPADGDDAVRVPVRAGLLRRGARPSGLAR